MYHPKYILMQDIKGFTDTFSEPLLQYFQTVHIQHPTSISGKYCLFLLLTLTALFTCLQMTIWYTEYMCNSKNMIHSTVSTIVIKSSEFWVLLFWLLLVILFYIAVLLFERTYWILPPALHPLSCHSVSVVKERGRRDVSVRVHAFALLASLSGQIELSSPS